MTESRLLAVLASAAILLLNCSDDNRKPVEPPDDLDLVVGSIVNEGGSNIYMLHDTVHLTAEVATSDSSIVPDSSIAWTSDKDGPLGSGRELIIDSLTADLHTIGIQLTGYRYDTTELEIEIKIVSSLGDYTFDRTFGIGTYMDEGFYGLETKNGGYLVAGMTLLKTDSKGNLLWERRDIDGFHAIETRDSCFLIVSNYATDAMLIKTDQNGETLWEETYGGPETNQALTGLETHDGGYLIAGGTDNYDGIYLLRTDSDGNIVWEKGVGDLTSKASSVCEASDQGYILAGYSIEPDSGGCNAYVVKTDLLGNLIWERSCGGDGTQEFNSVTRLSDGSYMLTGTTNLYDDNAWDSYLVKIDSLGNLIWEISFSEAGFRTGVSIQQTSDGNLMVAGSPSMFKVSPDGDVFWTRTFNQATHFGFESSYGGYILVGGRIIGDERFVSLIKTDPNGDVF